MPSGGGAVSTYSRIFGGVSGERSTTDDLKLTHRAFVAAIRHPILTPYINGCVAPHPKRETVEDPDHDDQ